MIVAAVRGRRRRVPDQHEPHPARQHAGARRRDPQGREGLRSADRHPGRPARAEAAGRRLRRRLRHARQWSHLHVRRRSHARRRHARAPAASGNLRGRAGRPYAAARRRQDPPGRHRSQQAEDRGAGPGRRQALQPQGREPARLHHPVLGAHARRTAPISMRRSTPASTGSGCPSCSGPRTSPRPRRSRAAAPP